MKKIYKKSIIKQLKKAVVGLVAASMLVTFAPFSNAVASAATVTKGSYDFSNMTIRRVWFNTEDPVFLIDNYQRVWLDANVNVLATGTETDVSTTSDLMAPMKEMFAQIGAEYTESDNDITITMNGMTLRLTVGSNDVELNGTVISDALTSDQIPQRVNVKESAAEYNTYLTEDYYVTYLPVAYVLSTFQADIYQDAKINCFYAAIPVFNTDNVASYDTSSEGYGSRYDTLLDGTIAQSTEVADNIVALQNEDGGWQSLPDNTEMSQSDLASKLGSIEDVSTLENGATTAELQYLATYITNNSPTDTKYQDAFVSGVQFLLENQLDNGGWQMQPTAADGFNGNIEVGNSAMTSVLTLLSDIGVLNNQNYVFARKVLDVEAIQAAVTKGTDFLIDTQIINEDVKSGWATQYDTEGNVTMGRTYERESVSSYTTKDVVDYLMTIHDPSTEICDAVNSAVSWLSDVRIADKEQSVVADTSMNNGFDVYLVDGDGTWASNYVYDETSAAYRPLYSDVDPSRPDQPYVNIYEVNELNGSGTTADSSDLILYATRTTISYYNNTLATELITTDYVTWQGYVANGFPAIPTDPVVADEDTGDGDQQLVADIDTSTEDSTIADDATNDTSDADSVDSSDSSDSSDSDTQTVDRMQVVFYLILVLASAGGVAACIYKKRKVTKRITIKQEK